MVAIGFQAYPKESIDSIVSDAAGLHIMAFAVEEFINRVFRHNKNCVNPAAMLHLQKGLKILRERLLGEDEKIKISDSTIGVVVKLAGAAHFNGDYHISTQHMNGLRKMVDLRGGLDVVKDNKLRTEMLR